jgi:hypothetical protein
MYIYDVTCMYIHTYMYIFVYWYITSRCIYINTFMYIYIYLCIYLLVMGKWSIRKVLERVRVRTRICRIWHDIHIRHIQVRTRTRSNRRAAASYTDVYRCTDVYAYRYICYMNTYMYTYIYLLLLGIYSSNFLLFEK